MMIGKRKPKASVEVTLGEKIWRLCHAVANEMSVSVSIIVCISPFVIAAIAWKKIWLRRKRRGRKHHHFPDLPRSIPPLPAHFLQRHALEKKIVDTLLRDTDNSTPMGVHFVLGPEGTGKSTLAAAAVRNTDVRKCFSGGIAWIDASKKWGECGRETNVASLLRQYQEIQQQLKIQSLDFRDPFVTVRDGIDDGRDLDRMEDAKDLMAGFLSKRKPILLVLQNFHTRDDIRWYDFSVSGRAAHQCLILMDDENIWRVLPTANFTYCGRIETHEAHHLLSKEAEHPAVLHQSSLGSFEEIAVMSQRLPAAIVTMGRSMALQASRGDVIPVLSLLGAMKTSCSGQARGVDDLMKAIDGVITVTFRDEALAAKLCLATLVTLWGKNHPEEWFEASVIDVIFEECCAQAWCSGPWSDENAEGTDSFLKQALNSQGIRIRQLFSAIGILRTSQRAQGKKSKVCCQFSHDLFRQYGYYLSITQKGISGGCQVAVNAFLAMLVEHERMLPKRSLLRGTDVFAVESLPYHLIVCGRLEEAATLLQHQQFCSHRLEELGFVEGTRLHVFDSEELYLRNKDGPEAATNISPPVLKMKKAYAAMSACLSEKFMSSKNASRKKVGKILYDMGYSLLNHGSRANALKYFEDAIAVQREALSESHAAIGRTINNVGMLYKGGKDKSLSIKYFGTSKQICEDFSVDTLERTPELFVAAISRQRPDYEDDGLWFYKEQLWTRMQELVDGPTVDLAKSLLTACCVHHSNDECDEAMDLLGTAIQIYILLGIPKDHSSILFLLECKEKAQKLMLSNP